VCADGQTACLDHSHPRFAPLLAALLAGNGAKRTVDLKKIYAYGYKHQVDIQNVVFDAELAAYLLNPNASGYALRQLATGLYGLPLPWCGDEDANTALGALAADACLLGPVCDRLEDDLQKTGQLALLREIELPLCRVLASMERVGFRLDTAGLAALGGRLDSRLEELTARIHLEAGGGFNLNSPQQLAGVLFDRLGLPARKKTKSASPPTPRSWIRCGACIDRRGYSGIPKACEAQVHLCGGTFYASWATTAGLRTSFRQTETRTGRISSTEPNLQNIPVRTELGSELRKFFVAGEGQALVDADYSQIELRVLAHIARDDHMIEAFTKNEDIHTLTAAQVFGMPPTFVTPQMRSRAKAVNFGIVYGIGAFSLSQDIGVSVAEADRYIKSYLQSYSGVRQYMQDTVAAAKQNGYVTTLYGRRRPVPELTAQNRSTRQFRRARSDEHPIQGTAADIIKLAMIPGFRPAKAENIPARLILLVHYELIVESDSAGGGRSRPHPQGRDGGRRDAFCPASGRCGHRAKLVRRQIVPEEGDVMRIVPMGAAHIPALAALEESCFSQPWSAAALAAELDKPGSLFLVAEGGGEPAGYVGLNAVLDEGYICNVAVRPDFRRRGVASALLSELLRRCGERGLSFVSLEVRRSNEAAVSLYAGLGFVPVGVRPGFYEAPREDA
jgi:DNA polymerase-1